MQRAALRAAVYAGGEGYESKRYAREVEAQLLWHDSMLLEVPARSFDEPRYVIIGRIGDKHWSAVITYRAGRTRIISVRRSRHEEVGLYEG